MAELIISRGGHRQRAAFRPLIPPYLEIEADSRDYVAGIASLLGFDDTQLTGETPQRFTPGTASI